MKNFAWITVGVCAFLGYSIFMSVNTDRTIDGLLDLSEVEAMAAGEDLPEVEIICGEKEGRCWVGDCNDVTHTSFGSYRSWICDKFTGYQNDVCFNGLPCW